MSVDRSRVRRKKVVRSPKKGPSKGPSKGALKAAMEEVMGLGGKMTVPLGRASCKVGDCHHVCNILPWCTLDPHVSHAHSLWAFRRKKK